MGIKNIASGTSGCLLMLMYFGVGLLQLAAIVSAVEGWTGLPFIVGFIPSLIIAYIPIVGVIVGIIGAVQAWDWTVLAAIGLFVAPYALGVLFYILGRAYDTHEL